MDEKEQGFNLKQESADAGKHVMETYHNCVRLCRPHSRGSRHT